MRLRSTKYIRNQALGHPGIGQGGLVADALLRVLANNQKINLLQLKHESANHKSSYSQLIVYMKKVHFTSTLFFSIVFATFNACNLGCQNSNSQKNNNLTVSDESTILEKEVQSPILQINKNLDVAISDPVKLICDRRKNIQDAKFRLKLGRN